VFRGLLLLRAILSLLGLVVSLSDHDAFDRIPRYLLLGMAIAIYAMLLTPLVGLWCYHRWARVVFIVILILDVLDLALPHQRQPSFHLPSSFRAIGFLIQGLNGAIVAMMFLPPTRELFGRRSNQPLQPTAGRRDE
jgi:hypothetical protein